MYNIFLILLNFNKFLICSHGNNNSSAGSVDCNLIDIILVFNVVMHWWFKWWTKDAFIKFTTLFPDFIGSITCNINFVQGDVSSISWLSIFSSCVWFCSWCICIICLIRYDCNNVLNVIVLCECTDDWELFIDNIDNMNEYNYDADMNLDVHMFYDNMYQILLYDPMLLLYLWSTNGELVGEPICEFGSGIKETLCIRIVYSISSDYFNSLGSLLFLEFELYLELSIDTNGFVISDNVAKTIAASDTLSISYSCA